MARLLSAMEAQRATSSKSTLQMPSTHQPASDQGLQQQQLDAGSKVTQLLNTAAGQLSKLLSENVQLFPSDMGDMLKAYRYGCAHGIRNTAQTCLHACSPYSPCLEMLACWLLKSSVLRCN